MKHQSSDVYSSMILLYYLSKVAGLAPFKLVNVQASEKKGKTCLRLKKGSVFEIAQSILMIFIILTAASCIVILNYKLPNNQRNYLILEMLLTVATSIACLILCMTKISRNIDSILYKIKILDGILMVSEETHNKNIKNNIIHISIVLCIFVSRNVYDFWVWKIYWNLWNPFLYTIYLCEFVHLITIAQFVNFVMLLKQKLHCINLHLSSPMENSEEFFSENIWENLLRSSNFPNFSIFKKDLRIYEFHEAMNKHCSDTVQIWIGTSTKINSFGKEKSQIRALEILYYFIYEICSRINLMYQVQILMFTTSTFVELTSNLYYTFVTIKSIASFDMIEAIYAMETFVWALLDFMLLFCITGSCNKITQESWRTSCLLQKLLLLPGIDAITCDELKLFLDLVKEKQVKFTVCGFFTLNFTVLSSIIGAVTTLLVIFVQFNPN
ncbi:hypothetical protein L9F63_004932, partial [Diploptera punctata]